MHLVLSFVLWSSLFVSATSHRRDEIGEKSALRNAESHEFDNDFEDGSITPWLDLSEGGTQWTIECSHPDYMKNKKDETKQPPPPQTGKYFLSLKHADLKTFDVGILSTTNLIAFPGDMVQFSYCISSTWSQFHNLQVRQFYFVCFSLV